jgi:hypothetical protein
MMESLGWAVSAFATLPKADRSGAIRVQNTPVVVAGQQVKIARDFLGRPRLLIPASHDVSAEESTRVTAGLSIELQSYPNAEGTLIPHLVFAANSSEVDDLFALMSQDICEAVRGSSEAISLAMVESRILAWQQMLAKLTNREPSLAEQVGLFGELLTLEALVDELGSDALASWSGPDLARHDFETALWALEVKSSLSLASKRAHIHGFGQLESAAGTSLNLLHLQLEQSLGSKSIADLVGGLAGKLDRQAFEAQLQRFFPEGISELPAWASKFQLKLSAASLFAVDSTFPRIVRVNLGPDNFRFSQLQYQLDLEGLPHEVLEISPLRLGVKSW